jgi:hypothetical protein
MIGRTMCLVPQVPALDDCDKVVFYLVVNFATSLAVFVWDRENGEDHPFVSEEGHVNDDLTGELSIIFSHLRIGQCIQGVVLAHLCS